MKGSARFAKDVCPQMSRRCGKAGRQARHPMSLSCDSGVGFLSLLNHTEPDIYDGNRVEIGR